MFNGLIKYTGTIKYIKKKNNSMILGIRSNILMKNIKIGSSISCDGACLTLTSYKNKILSFYLSSETLKRTNLSSVKVGKIINLEKSLSYGDEISGHIVQGHVDTIGRVSNIKVLDKTWIVRIVVPSKYSKYLIEKASIHINGVSLTISKKQKKQSFEVNIIPHTLFITSLKNLKKNYLVNVEFDIFGKYIYEINN